MHVRLNLTGFHFSYLSNRFLATVSGRNIPVTAVLVGFAYLFDMVAPSRPIILLCRWLCQQQTLVSLL